MNPKYKLDDAKEILKRGGKSGTMGQNSLSQLQVLSLVKSDQVGIYTGVVLATMVTYDASE